MFEWIGRGVVVEEGGSTTRFHPNRLGFVGGFERVGFLMVAMAVLIDQLFCGFSAIGE